ncbi:unnamed protein product [Amoebophrya sp. A120]|nr:unnamed protein product [Amoebophrya sp. A120]|eukprot:GSA120T00014312001.1
MSVLRPAWGERRGRRRRFPTAQAFPYRVTGDWGAKAVATGGNSQSDQAGAAGLPTAPLPFRGLGARVQIYGHGRPRGRPAGIESKGRGARRAVCSASCGPRSPRLVYGARVCRDEMAPPAMLPPGQALHYTSHPARVGARARAGRWLVRSVHPSHGRPVCSHFHLLSADAPKPERTGVGRGVPLLDSEGACFSPGRARVGFVF